MDLSEIEIYFGHNDMVFFAFIMKKNTNKSWRTLLICMFTFYFKIIVSEARGHITNHWCSCLETALFIFAHSDVTVIWNTFQWFINL